MSAISKLCENGFVKSKWDEDMWFVSEQGIKFPFYIDFRGALSNTSTRNSFTPALVTAVSEILEGLESPIICGMSTAGIPWASFAADRLGIDLAYYRPKPKGYGLQLQHEGCIEPESEIVIVDDVMRTGSSIQSAFDYFEGRGYHTETAVVLANLSNSSCPIEYSDFSVQSLYTYMDILTESVRQGIINQRQSNILCSFYSEQQINWEDQP